MLGLWGTHYYKNCPHPTRTELTAKLKEASTVGQLARILPKINAALEDHQVDFHPAMTELEGKLFNQT